MKITNISDHQFEPASHEDHEKPGVIKKVLFNKEDFDPECGLKMLNFAQMEVGQAFAKHFHETLEEVFYILEGEAEIEIDGESRRLSKDMAVLIPRKAVHQMRNIGQVPLKYLAFGASRQMGATVVVDLPEK